MIGLCRDGDGTWKIKPSSSYFYLLKAGVYLHNTLRNMQRKWRVCIQNIKFSIFPTSHLHSILRSVLRKYTPA